MEDGAATRERERLERSAVLELFEAVDDVSTTGLSTYRALQGTHIHFWRDCDYCLYMRAAVVPSCLLAGVAPEASPLGKPLGCAPCAQQM